MPDRKLTVLFDGDCPICRREVGWLRRRDRRNRLRFEDFAAESFDPDRYGLDPDTVMAAIHGVLPDGRVIRGMEVFRRAYAAVGLGWLLAPTGWPILRSLFDRFYALFARNRVAIGRLFGRRCEDGACAPRTDR